MSLEIPEKYESKLDIRETEVAIKAIKDYFERALAKKLNLTRVSAPLFVMPNSGINDDLNGVERPVKFEVAGIDNQEVEVVHSLAKWKRAALHRYGFSKGEGLYTDMDAIRRDEELDNLHSVYVDQWDWEMIIDKSERNTDKLKATVEKLFEVFKETEEYITGEYKCLEKFLPEKVTFISSQELEDMYPELTPKQREDKIAEKYKAVFITQIGAALKSGVKHDGRAPDYDDWSLNGDLIFWFPVLNHAFEVSSMGIRVDEDSLLSQLKAAGCEERAELDFHKAVLNKELPYTLGGGLGQSRICMFLLGKAHIGEVQASVWSRDMIDKCAAKGINLL